MMQRLRHLLRNEHGAEPVALAITATAWILLLALVIALGRIGLAGNAVRSAAGAAARAATLQHDAGSAQQAASSAATDALNAASYNCRRLTTDLDTGDVDVPLGQVGVVDVTINCIVSLNDIAIPGLPGSITLTSTATSPVDPYSER